MEKVPTNSEGDVQLNCGTTTGITVTQSKIKDINFYNTIDEVQTIKLQHIQGHYIC